MVGTREPGITRALCFRAPGLRPPKQDTAHVISGFVMEPRWGSRSDLAWRARVRSFRGRFYRTDNAEAGILSVIVLQLDIGPIPSERAILHRIGEVAAKA